MTATTGPRPQSRPQPRGWFASVRVETLAWAVVALVAVLVRAIQLGVAPLDAREASQALAALRFAGGEALPAGSIVDPLVFGGTALSFALFQATDAAARLVPLLGGVGLALSPLLFRHRLRRSGALIAAAWLALSPVAVGASRRLDGTALSMLLLVVTLAAADRFLLSNRRGYGLLVGAALGAALLADSGVLVAVLALAVGWGFARLTDDEEQLTPEAWRAVSSRVPWGLVAAAFAGTIATLGTLFFLAPGGLGAAADQLWRFLAGFVRPVPGALPAFISLIVYEPGLVVFGLVGAWLATQSSRPWQRALAGWALAAVILTLAYRGAHPEHALWAVVPLAPLAGLAVRTLLGLRHDAPPWAAWGYPLALIALAGMILASLTHHLREPRVLPFPPAAPQVNIPLDLVLVGLWVAMILLLWMSASSLWSRRLAWRGAATALLVITGLVSAGQSAALAFSRPASPYEPFNVHPSQPGLDRLAATAAELGDVAVGYADDVTLTVQAEPESPIAWALRDFHRAEFVERVDPTVSSVLVVTPAEGADPALGSSYVGQDFVVEERWLPRGLDLANTLRWLIYRQAGAAPEQERAILWVREDVYRLVQAGGTPGEP